MIRTKDENLYECLNKNNKHFQLNNINKGGIIYKLEILKIFLCLISFEWNKLIGVFIYCSNKGRLMLRSAKK